MFWYGAWGPEPWFILPMLMCVVMMAVMMVFMGRGLLRGSGHVDEPPSDPAVDALRQRFASGELTQQEFEEQRRVLVSL